MNLRNNDLYQKHDKLIKLKTETYDRILKNCLMHIKKTANMGNLTCVFEIPLLIFGSSFPKINIESCGKYIIYKLNRMNKNISAKFIEPNYVFIDWRRYDEDDYV